MASRLLRKNDLNDFSLLGALGEENGKDFVVDLSGVYYHAHFLPVGEEIEEDILERVMGIANDIVEKPLFEAKLEGEDRIGFLFPLRMGGNLSALYAGGPSFRDFVKDLYIGVSSLLNEGITPLMGPEDVLFDEGRVYVAYPFETKRGGICADFATFLAYFLSESKDGTPFEDFAETLSEEGVSALGEIGEEEGSLIEYLLGEEASLDMVAKWLEDPRTFLSKPKPSVSSLTVFYFLDAPYEDPKELAEAFQEHFLYAIPLMEKGTDGVLLSFLEATCPEKVEECKVALNSAISDPSLALFRLIHILDEDASFVYGSKDFVSLKEIVKNIQSNPSYSINPLLLKRDYLLASLSKKDKETMILRNRVLALFDLFPSLTYEATKVALANLIKEPGRFYFKGECYDPKSFALNSLRLYEKDEGFRELMANPKLFLNFFLLSDGCIAQDKVSWLSKDCSAEEFLARLSFLLTNKVPYFYRDKEGKEKDIEDYVALIELSNEAYEKRDLDAIAFYSAFLSGPAITVMDELFGMNPHIEKAKRGEDRAMELYYVSKAKPKFRGIFSSMDELVEYVLTKDDPEMEAKALYEDKEFQRFLRFYKEHSR